MRVFIWPVLVLLAALLEACSGLFRDASTGVATMDPALLLTLAAGAWGGPACGVLCGLLGGLVVGAPGNLGVQSGFIYAVAGLLTALVARRRGLTGLLQVAGLGALATAMLACMTGSLLASLTLIGHNAALALLLPLTLRLGERS